MKVKAKLSIGFGTGASHEEILELKDTLTEEEIEEEVKEWADNYIEISWKGEGK
jgi:hypothetical protein